MKRCVHVSSRRIEGVGMKRCVHVSSRRIEGVGMKRFDESYRTKLYFIVFNKYHRRLRITRVS